MPSQAEKYGTNGAAGHVPSVHAGFLSEPGVHGLVSVIVPTYNRASIVGRTIDSVLAQSYSKFELIIIDDGSTDGTREVIAGYDDPRIRYVYKENGGLSSARNAGLAEARGEFIAFLDSDDLWREWKLEAQMTIFRRHPEVGLIWSDMSTFEREDRVIEQRHLRSYYAAYAHLNVDDEEIRSMFLEPELVGHHSEKPVSYYVGDFFRQMFHGNLVHPPTAIVARDRVRRAGRFQPEITGAGAEDYHFYFRICQLGAAAFLDAPTMLYRIHPGQMSTLNRLNEARGNLNVLEHWITSHPSVLPADNVRTRLAAAHAWLAAEELNVGHRQVAARHFSTSLRIRGWHRYTAMMLVVSLLPTNFADLLRGLKRHTRKLLTKPAVAILVVLTNDQEMFFRIIGLFQPEFADFA